jgi:threonine aldolase
MKVIDLRSDTVTKPTKPMLEAMFNAQVGDDVFADDPTVNSLEEKIAKMFDKEAALFCSSGTQTNQIAIKVHTQPGDELICDRTAHIYNYEGGGISFNSGVQARLVFGNKGIFSANDVLENINVDNVHFPNTKLVCIENTVNKGGGSIWKKEQMQSIKKVCEENNLKLHLDGARIFNALAETKNTTQQIGEIFDSISVCFSKGLGCPIGSVLIGKKDFVYQARRVRKIFGGGMRQAGYLAAAASYALDHHIERISTDHQRAKILAKIIQQKTYIDELIFPETNIIIFKLKKEFSIEKFIQHFAKHEIKIVSAGIQTVRFVTHLDIDDTDLERIEKALNTF